MKPEKRWVGAGIGIALSGCAALPPQQFGHIAGTMAGAVIAPGVGAPVGGLIGLLAGLVVQKEVDYVTEKHERVALGAQLEGPESSGDPQVAPPTVLGSPKRVWVDETLRDGRQMAGRFEERHIP